MVGGLEVFLTEKPHTLGFALVPLEPGKTSYVFAGICKKAEALAWLPSTFPAEWNQARERPAVPPAQRKLDPRSRQCCCSNLYVPNGGSVRLDSVAELTNVVHSRQSQRQSASPPESVPAAHCLPAGGPPPTQDLLTFSQDRLRSF